MNLVDWIEEQGIEKVTKVSGHTRQTVYLWQKYEATPRPMTAAKLIEASDGKLSWDSIYEPFVRFQMSLSSEKQLSLI